MAASVLKIDVDVFGEIEPNPHNYRYMMNESLSEYMKIREDLTQCLIMCGIINKRKLPQELAIEHNLDFTYM